MIQVRTSFHVTRSFIYASTINIDQTAIFSVCSLLLVSIIRCTQSMPDGTAGVFRRLPDRPWETLSGRWMEQTRLGSSFRMTRRGIYTGSNSPESEYHGSRKVKWCITKIMTIPTASPGSREPGTTETQLRRGGADANLSWSDLSCSWGRAKVRFKDKSTWIYIMGG